MEIEYGTRNINIRWDPPTIFFNSLTDTLRGSVDNLTYYVRVGEQEIATNVTEVNLTSADGLLPGTQYTIEVSTCHACYMYIHIKCLLVKNLRTLAILWLCILLILTPPSVITAGQLRQPHQHKRLCMNWSAALTTIPYPHSQAVGETAWQLLQVQTVYECNVMAISHSSSEYQISARDRIFQLWEHGYTRAIEKSLLKWNRRDCNILTHGTIGFYCCHVTTFDLVLPTFWQRK